MQNHVAKVHQHLYVFKDEDNSSREGRSSRTSESEASSQNSSQNWEDSEHSSKDARDLDTRTGEDWVGGSHTPVQSQEGQPSVGRFENEGCFASPEYPQSHLQPGGSGSQITYASPESVDSNASSQESYSSPQEPISSPQEAYSSPQEAQHQQTPSQESQDCQAIHSSTPYGYATPLLLGLDKTYQHNFQM